MKLRKAKKEDFEEYYKLEVEYTKYNNSLEKEKKLRYKVVKTEQKKSFLKNLKKRNKLFLVLEEEGNLFGYLYGTIEKGAYPGYRSGVKKLGYLENIYVSKKIRAKGFGRKLIDEYLKFLKEKKIQYVFLHAVIPNKIALEFYKKLKFTPIEYKMMKKI
jgi:[ribosomal protein S18]-alanine N-acetyltransferase